MRYDEKFAKMALEIYEMDKEELIKRVDVLAGYIRNVVQADATLKTITLEVLEAIKYSLHCGIKKSNINRDKTKIALKLLKELAKQQAHNEEEKKIIEFVAQMTENYIDRTIKAGRTNGRW